MTERKVVNAGMFIERIWPGRHLQGSLGWGPGETMARIGEEWDKTVEEVRKDGVQTIHRKVELLQNRLRDIMPHMAALKARQAFARSVAASMGALADLSDSDASLRELVSNLSGRQIVGQFALHIDEEVQVIDDNNHEIYNVVSVGEATIFLSCPNPELGTQDWSRTSTPFRAPPPQDGVSTNFTTWAGVTESRANAFSGKDANVRQPARSENYPSSFHLHFKAAKFRADRICHAKILIQYGVGTKSDLHQVRDT